MKIFQPCPLTSKFLSTTNKICKSHPLLRLSVLVGLMLMAAVALGSSSSAANVFGPLFARIFDNSQARTETKVDSALSSASTEYLSPQDAGSTMSVERRGHTATRLSDGRVLIAGGENSGGTLNGTEIYDPVSATFSTTGNMSAARADHTATLLSDGRVLIAGGRNGAGAQATTETFDPVTGTFASGPQMGVARTGHSATVFTDGRIMFAGGDAVGSAEILDATLSNFTATGSMNAARSMHSAAPLQDGHVLIVGGRDTEGNALSSGEIFDGTYFSAVDGNLTVARSGAVLRVLFDGKVQIIGGNYDGSMEIYDPAIERFGAYAHVSPEGDTCAGLPSQIQASQTRAALFHNGQSDATFDRSNHSITELTSQAMVVGGANSAGSVLSSTPIFSGSNAAISTDKLDYAPGETAHIIGRGFQPGETVRVKIHEDPHTPHERGMDVVADGNGNFVGYYLVMDYDLNMKFLVGSRGLTSGLTAQTTFTDTSNQITQIAFNQTGPATVTAGVSNGPLSVQLRNSSGIAETLTGNVINSSVTIVLSSSSGTGSFSATAGGTFTTTLSQTINSGTAGQPTFPNFFYKDSLAGSVIITATVTAKGSGLTNLPLNSTATLNKTVVAGAATNLAFAQQPSSADKDATIAPPVTVRIEDATGNLVTTSTRNVTLAIGTNPGGGTLEGTTTLAAVNGIATFNDLSINKGGTGYTVVATSPTPGPALSQATSNTFDINKLNQTISFAALGNKTYGDPAFDVSATGGASGLAVTFTAGPAAVCNSSGTNGQTITIMGVGVCSVTASQAGNSDYNAAADVNQAFTIDKAATTTTVNCGAGPFGYNGAAHEPCTASVTSAAGLNEVLTVSYLNNVNAGTATASASYAESANYLGSNDSENFTIDKAATTTTVTCGAGPFFYNGAAHEPCTASVTGPAGLSESLTVSYLNNVNAGTATASASYAETANYLGSNDSENFTIDKAATTTTVTCGAGPFVYNGAAHEPCTASVTGPAGLNEVLTVSYLNNVNAGTATASASYAETANYLGSNDSENFTIDKAATTTTVTCGAGPFVYNGAAHEPCTASVTGPAGLSESLTVSYLNNVDAGTATANASYGESANYLGSNDSENFTIDKATSTTTVTCPGSVTYTGLALEPCSASVTGAGGLNQSLTVNYTDNINAGTANASASFDGDDNHTGSNDTESFTIDRATSTTAVTCPSSVTYTGLALEPCSASVTGAGSLNQSLTVNYSNNTNAGTASASASYPGDANHDGSSDSKNFTIDKASSTTTVTCPAGPFTYTGMAQTPCTANVTGAGGLNQSLTVNYTDNTNAGTATASASFDGDSNHNSSNDTKNFTIDKATLSVTADNKSMIFGSITPPAFTATYVGFVAGQNVSNLGGPLTFTVKTLPLPGVLQAVNASTPVGTYAIIPGGLTSNNYQITFNDTGRLTVGAWTITGFYQPVDMNVGATFILNTVKGGSTVPLKFNIYAGTPGPLTERKTVADVMFGSIQVAAYDCTTTPGYESPVDVSNTGNTNLRYDTTGAQFIQNWQTPKAPNKCYQVRMTALDGSHIDAFFKTK